MRLFGYYLPTIRHVTFHYNGDWSATNTGKQFSEDERGVYYTRPLCFEWLGYATPLHNSYFYNRLNGLCVDPPPHLAR